MLNDRQKKIVEKLAIEGEVRISNLTNEFQVTEMTIRRDLEKLEAKGMLRRTFGGAIAVMKDIALRERSSVRMEEKKWIGEQAASLVKPGESVFIDGGSTTMQVARYLKPMPNLTVVTNALNIAAELVEKGISTVVIGGTVIGETLSMVGPLAIEAMRNIAFDRVFLGATGCTAQHGFSNSNLYDAEIKRMALEKGSEVIVVLDHSKFDVKAMVSYAELSQVDVIVTDKMDSQLLLACREAGVKVIHKEG